MHVTGADAGRCASLFTVGRLSHVLVAVVHDRFTVIHCKAATSRNRAKRVSDAAAITGPVKGEEDAEVHGDHATNHGQHQVEHRG